MDLNNFSCSDNNSNLNDYFNNNPNKKTNSLCSELCLKLTLNKLHMNPLKADTYKKFRIITIRPGSFETGSKVPTQIPFRGNFNSGQKLYLKFIDIYPDKIEFHTTNNGESIEESVKESIGEYLLVEEKKNKNKKDFSGKNLKGIKDYADTYKQMVLMNLKEFGKKIHDVQKNNIDENKRIFNFKIDGCKVSILLDLKKSNLINIYGGGKKKKRSSKKNKTKKTSRKNKKRTGSRKFIK